MTTVALIAVLAASQAQKTLVLDDFTVGAWSWTLAQKQSIDHVSLNLDKRHCLFGNRTVALQIVSNPNNTTLTFALGNHEQKLTSPLQVAWLENGLEYGNDAPSDIDLSAVEDFILDMYSVGGSYLPDILSLTVHDRNFVGGSTGWLLRQGGAYFRRSSFPVGIDWHHITYMSVRQDFNHLPNPTTYSVTNFYATLKPGAIGPGFKMGGQGKVADQGNCPVDKAFCSVSHLLLPDPST